MQKCQKWRWFTGVSLCLLALFCLGWVISNITVAHASTGLLTCAGNEAITYSPGITNTPRTVTGWANDTIGSCVASTRSGPSSGTASFTVSIPNATCTSITHPVYTVNYSWNDGTQSVISFSNTTTTKLVTGETLVISTGNVISGAYVGEHAQRTLTNLNTNLLACFTSQGLQSNAGPFTLEIL